MWLFYVDVTGYIAPGSYGQIKIPSKCKTKKQIIQYAYNWLGVRRGAIYFVEKWTNEMSTYGPRAFEQYIITHMEKIAYS